MKHKSPVSSAFRLLPLVLVLPILAGCEGNHLVQGDPFFGPQAASRPVAPAGGGAATQTAGNTVPPLPGSTTVPSQASLAGGASPAPEDARHMRIDAPLVPVSSQGGAARGAAPGNVQVDGPIPIADSTSNRAPLPIPQGGLQQIGAAAPSSPASGSMTFEQAQQILKQRGVVWQRWELDRGQWKLQCSRPLPGGTNLNRNYVAKAQEPLLAVRAVIEQIEKDKN